MQTDSPEIAFVEVLLPLPVKGTFTYRVSFSLMKAVRIGVRVVVQFGKKKIYTGLITEVHTRIPKQYQPKYILSIVDEKPVVLEKQLAFWNWMKDYYMCYAGEVMNAALPSGLKLASETKLVLHPDFDGDLSVLNEKEYLVAEALGHREIMTLTELSELTGMKRTVSLVKNLLEKRVIILQEEIEDVYKPRSVIYVRLASAYHDGKALSALFNQLEKKAYKQLELLMTYIRLSDFYSPNPDLNIRQTILLKESGAAASQVQALEKKGVLEVQKMTESRLAYKKATDSVDSITLSPAQQTAWDAIMASFQEKQVSLLHGVTGSGKTELYIKLIAQTLMEGKQVLYLLPEIALTTQVISRLTRYFGEKAGVYHSKYNLYERVEIWNEVLAFHPHKDAKFQVIIGARSAIFLPFRHLGLVIVDEEHDTSYKQQDPAPRYNGRDAAIYLATQHQAKVLLGTATPSIETYFHAMGQKFGYIPLKERYGNLALPEIHVVNIQEEKKRDRMPSVFSEPLITAMEKAFADKKQVILFQNRRGFSLRLECQVCHWMPECKFCDVTLTYHKTQNMMLCHYCGYTEPVPEKCPECGSPEIFMKGYGTQQIEEELSMMYPDKVVKRLDLDTSRKKHGHQQIIHDFEAGKIDVLVGTQMVTKGLDFNHVSLVGIVDADSFLTYPDFRALERGFQLMAQVSGRSGRKDNRGQVIIQTRNPSHEAIQYVIENNYEDMFESQKLERYKFRYPPFYRMIRIDLKHKQSRKVDEGADVLARQLRKHFGKMVLGPEYPLVARVRNRYIKHILLKLPSDKALGQSKQKILKEIEAFKNRTGNKSIFIAVDVDPV